MEMRRCAGRAERRARRQTRGKVVAITTPVERKDFEVGDDQTGVVERRTNVRHIGPTNQRVTTSSGFGHMREQAHAGYSEPGRNLDQFDRADIERGQLMKRQRHV